MPAEPEYQFHSQLATLLLYMPLNLGQGVKLLIVREGNSRGGGGGGARSA